MKNFIVVSFFLLGLTLMVKSQEKKSYPEIGKTMPSFVFKNVENYHSKQLTNDDIKGRYAILDFWSTGCVVCIKSMPKMNHLQKQFKADLDIILVGRQERRRRIEDLYNYVRNKNDLDLISVYDSLYFGKFVPRGTPHLIWINEEGIIKAITTSDDVTEENIKRFVSGGDFTFSDYSYLGNLRKKSQIEYDASKPLLINGNGGEDTSYLFRSVLAKWKPGMGDWNCMPVKQSLDSYPGRSSYQMTRVGLDEIFKMAYFGTYYYKKNNIYPKVILNCRDSALLFYDHSGNGKGLYSYSIAVPKERASEDCIMKDMQLDLYKYFGLHAEVVEILQPYVAIVISDSVKVKRMRASVNDDSKNLKWNLESSDVELTNIPISNLSSGMVSKYLPDNLFFFNETGLADDTEISMKFSAKLDDLASIRRGLQKFGLDLKPSKKLMKTLVISDPKD